MNTPDTITVPEVEPRRYFSILHRTSYEWHIRRKDEPWQEWLEEPFVDTTRILQVGCDHPTCSVGPLEPCRYPDGRMYQSLHKARYTLSLEEGWWGAATLRLPEVTP